MIHRLPVRAALVIVAATLGGCATSPEHERTFGQSLRASLASQVLNPEAASNTNPVLGIDAGAALGAQQQYKSSYTNLSRDPRTLVTNR